MSLAPLFLEPEVVFHKEGNPHIRPTMTWGLTTLPNMASNLMPCSSLSPTVEGMNTELQDILYLHAFNCCVKTVAYKIEKSIQTKVKRKGIKNKN